MNDGTTQAAWDAFIERELAKGRNGNGHGTTIAVAAQMWPTPSVPNGGQGMVTGTDVETQTRPDGTKAQIKLHHAASLWPTPQANADADSRNCEGSAAHQGTSLADAVYTGSSQTGRKGNTRRLNPKFVLWLMGFPPDWCDEIPRVDALRAAGNAVVPAQGAYAIALLWQELQAYMAEQEVSA